jgi:hypothetical protein
MAGIDMKTEKGWFRPQVKKSLQEPIRKLSVASGIDTRALISAALENFVSARQELLKEIESKKGE